MGNLPFSQQDMAKILASPEGRQLLSLLKADGGAALRQASQAVQSGDQEAAKRAISPMLDSPQVQALLRALDRQTGHG